MKFWIQNFFIVDRFAIKFFSYTLADFTSNIIIFFLIIHHFQKNIYNHLVSPSILFT